jgi:hypothetical protein
MSAHALRTAAKFCVAIALCLALVSCGTSTPPVVCDGPGSSSGTCTCGSGTSACPVSPGPEFLYAAGIGGQIHGFGLDHTSGELTSIGSVPGPAMSLGLAAGDNQFLYVSHPLRQLEGFLESLPRRKENSAREPGRRCQARSYPPTASSTRSTTAGSRATPSIRATAYWLQ